MTDRYPVRATTRRAQCEAPLRDPLGLRTAPSQSDEDSDAWHAHAWLARVDLLDMAQNAGYDWARVAVRTMLCKEATG